MDIPRLAEDSEDHLGDSVENTHREATEKAAADS